MESKVVRIGNNVVSEIEKYKSLLLQRYVGSEELVNQLSENQLLHMALLDAINYEKSIID